METPLHRPEDVNITNIPHDFKVACKLFNIPVRAFLQLFVDHVSFYDAVCNTGVDMHKLATRTIIRHHHQLENGEVTTQPLAWDMLGSDRQKCIQLIKSIIALSKQSSYDDKQRRKYAKALVSDLSLYIGRKKSHHTDVIYLNDDAITITPDFSVLCGIESSSPLAEVAHFMERVSLAEHWARKGLNQMQANPAMAFFANVQKGYGNLRPSELPHSDIITDLIDAYKEANLSLFIHRSLSFRKRYYQQLLTKFYNEIIQREK